MAKVESKNKRIGEIVTMLEKGMERKSIVQILTKKYKVCDATIDKEIRAAKLILHSRNSHKEQVRLEQTTDTLKEAVNEAILSDLEIEAILCKIASGNMQVSEILAGVPILRDISPMEVIQAAKTIYTKRGSNAPTKSAITDSAGKDVTPTFAVSVFNSPVEIVEKDS